MNLNDRKRHILAVLGVGPQPASFFTADKIEKQSAQPLFILRDLDELVNEGLIEKSGMRFCITDEGRKENGDRSAFPTSRLLNNATTTGPASAPKFCVREGADDHLKHRSHGTLT